jgi:hypothetical protein
MNLARFGGHWEQLGDVHELMNKFSKQAQQNEYKYVKRAQR